MDQRPGTDAEHRAATGHDFLQRTLADVDPQIADAEFDQLLRELIDLEERYPELKSPDSPTQRVGAAPSQKFAPYEHHSPMLSLSNAFDAQELRAFDERVRKLAGRPVPYVVELKIDGLATSLRYRDGSFERGGTRGDGRVGEDVTPNLRTIGSIPLRVRGSVPSEVEARGEVYLRKSDFEALNEARTRQGQPVFANPRNAASGGVRQLDPKLTKERRLSFFAYSIGGFEGGEAAAPRTQWEALQQLKSWGFAVNPNVRRVIAYLTGVTPPPQGLDLISVEARQQFVSPCAMSVSAQDRDGPDVAVHAAAKLHMRFRQRHGRNVVHALHAERAVPRDRAELQRAYDESGRRIMHLQASVEGFDVFARSLSIGPGTMVMHFDPSRPLHERYLVRHDFLSPETGREVVGLRAEPIVPVIDEVVERLGERAERAAVSRQARQLWAFSVACRRV